LEKDPSHLVEDPFGSAHQVSSVERILIQYPLDAVLEDPTRRTSINLRTSIGSTTLKKKHLGS